MALLKKSLEENEEDFKNNYLLLVIPRNRKSVLNPTFPLLWSSNTIHIGNLNTTVVKNYQV